MGSANLSQGAPLSAQDVALVQSTWAKVETISDTAASIFYGTLFELDPKLRRLFPEDLSEQRQKLMATIGFAIGALTKPDALLPAVQALGRRHAGYGILPSHYDAVGQALISTLAKGLGDAFTQQARTAWTRTYHVLASTMIAAAHG